MTRRCRRSRPQLLRSLAAASALLTVIAAFGEGAARAQQSGYGQTMGSTTQERNFYNYGPQQNNSSGSGSIFNATNPLDLLNQLKKGGALDDATTPDSAIDKALKDFEAKSVPAGGSPASTVKAP